MQRVGAFAQQLPQALFALIERAGEAVELASDNGELLLETVLRAACDRKTVLPFLESLTHALLAGGALFAVELVDEPLG
jgi:hypothetical protein